MKFSIFFSFLILLFGVIFKSNSSSNIEVVRGETPLRAFFASCFHTLKTVKNINSDEYLKIKMTFEKKEIYKSNEISNLLPADNNIIVIFTEGFSARWSHFYGGKYIDLMPQFDKIAQNSITVNNYFNHTSATFRGLRGQLISGFQELGGSYRNKTGLAQQGAKSYFKPINDNSLPVILRKYGYTSYFYLSQQNKLNDMLEEVGFDAVYGRDAILENELANSHDVGAVLSDEELFDGMFSSLSKKSEKEKFFAAMYNFDTHTGLSGGGTYGDGRNEVLNRFHKYDERLGIFFEKFKKSPLYKNTILIITADHSTFPDVHARNADDKIPKMFADQIPLIINYQGVAPSIINAQGQTSIAFAPSLLRNLNIKYEDNLFYGCPLEEQCGGNYYYNAGEETYSTRFNKVVRIDMNSTDDVRSMQSIDNYKKISNYAGF